MATAHISDLLAVSRWDFDCLEAFSWVRYAVIATLYTGLALFTRTSFDPREIFSRKNARSVESVLLIHGQFLMGILAVLLLAARVFPHMPGWLTDNTFSHHRSALDTLFIAGLVGATMVERKLLFITVKTDDDSSNDRVAGAR
jgi:hypothetical protein